ncbi:synaptonemal complex central element protein 3 [Pelodytes ibericus]
MESGPDTGSNNALRMLQDLDNTLDRMLEETEKISARAMWMAYDMVLIRTNPALVDSLRKLEESFSKCKDEVEKEWPEMLHKLKQNP